jgi:hypothetical protein
MIADRSAEASRYVVVARPKLRAAGGSPWMGRATGRLAAVLPVR